MKNGLKEEVQCVFFFAMIKKNVFHSSVLTPSIDYPEFRHKKIGAARKKLDKNCCCGKKLAAKKKKKNELLRASGEK